MSTPSTVSWVFKPANARSSLPPFNQPSPVTTTLAHWSPLATTSALSPAVSQIYSSPATPTSAATRLDSTSHRAVPISPQGSASSNGPARLVSSQDLLLPLMPSTEDSKLHNTVSGLRFALQQAQLNVDSLQQKVW